MSSERAGQARQVEIWTDGGCLPNPGKGGYAAVLTCGAHRKELSGGFVKTTNNRMEMMAAIVALEALKAPSTVTIHTDSQVLTSYLTERGQRTDHLLGESGMSRKSNGDLRVRLFRAVSRHKVIVTKVSAHSGVAENERCDQLATLARTYPGTPLLEDAGYSGKPYQRTFQGFRRGVGNPGGF